MDFLATQFEYYSVRNLFLCFSQYSATLTAGSLPDNSVLRENILNLSARISLCRTINRSLDYAACLTRIRKYGLGKHDLTSSFVTRLLTLANNLCDFIYYPAECIAWLIEANVFGPNRSSRRFRLLSLTCWLSNILVSIVGNLIKIIEYINHIRKHRNKYENDDVKQSLKVRINEIKKCVLTIINNICFLVNCVHWLAIPGFLWSTKLSVFMVGFCGTVATMCNIVKMMI